jgi:hypothetical protein
MLHTLSVRAYSSRIHRQEQPRPWELSVRYRWQIRKLRRRVKALEAENAKMRDDFDAHQICKEIEREADELASQPLSEEEQASVKRGVERVMSALERQAFQEHISALERVVDSLLPSKRIGSDEDEPGSICCVEDTWDGAKLAFHGHYAKAVAEARRLRGGK